MVVLDFSSLYYSHILFHLHILVNEEENMQSHCGSIKMHTQSVKLTPETGADRCRVGEETSFTEDLGVLFIKDS